MNNLIFGKEIEEMEIEELYSKINSDEPRFTILASNELIKRSLDDLQKIIKVFNEKSSKQALEMTILTKFIAGLTFVLVIGLVIQIFLSFF